MEQMNKLKDTFEQTSLQLAQHGKRTVNVLKEAFDGIDPDFSSDRYGTGEAIEAFEDKIARLLGKESAVFFPSGTMAQQIAMRIWSDEKQIPKVAYHPLCHLEIHEADGLKELHHIDSVLLADETRVIELADIVNIEEAVSCVLLELPQREIGGQLPSYETLEAISDYCRKQGIRLHLDGARLLEVLPYYDKTADEICALFDSVYVSMYKGIGGIAGAILAGDKTFTEKSKVWKQRHGGNLISLYPYILSADYYFDQRAGKMKQYYEDAKELAARFNGCFGISTVPELPASNMFHVHFKAAPETVAPILSDVHQETGIGISGYVRETGEERCYFEVSLGDMYREIPKEALNKLFEKLDEQMKTALTS